MSRVFVLADDQAVRADIETALRRHRHVVQSHGVGGFHTDAAREFAPDVVIMDLAGNGACAPARLALLRDPALHDVPVVALASSPDEARAFGAHAFLQRPLQPEDIPGVIDALLHPASSPLA
jgi:DNA-binding response OmpR family regulator